MKVYIGPYPDEGEQKIDVHIDKYDTWSMDHTLSYIIVPMLKQLKETKHGSPNVDPTEVPEELRPSGEWKKAYEGDGSADDKYHKRWDWVLDEMIWAFEQKTIDWNKEYFGEYVPSENDEGFGNYPNADWDRMKKHQERMSNGFRLFGKYYEALWD